jgi:hypothetical protein
MFQTKKERLRQWSLLGELLKSVGLLEALGFMASAFGASEIPWAALRAGATRGRGLSDLAAELAGKTPREVLDALRAGERDGRLPERLVDLAPRDPEAPAPAGDDSVASLVDLLFQEAIQKGMGGMLLTRTPAGDGELKVLNGEVWSSHSRYAAPVCGDLVRRVWMLAGQSYWAPKVGIIHRRASTGTVELRVTPGREGGFGIEIVMVPGNFP